jgi:CHAD domain-containing protein
MRDYARRQTAQLLHRVASAVERAARDADADAIHDVRVAMRRLSGCLRVFAPLYPKGPWKKVRRRISLLMTAAGVVRDCDIAIELAHKAGVGRSRALMPLLAAYRRKAARDLQAELLRWKDREYPRRWKRRLEVER